MTRLFTYKLTHDTGFAPNPFWGVLTIATCKPQIRLFKKVGDWIAGFTSKILCGDSVGQERLVFMMEVTKKLTFADYFNSSAYKMKIPKEGESKLVFRTGDNIYRPTFKRAHECDDFVQIENPNHGEAEKKKDLSGEYVLVSNKYFYFGKDALEIPREVRPNVPRGQSAHGILTPDQSVVQGFIAYVSSTHAMGIHGAPHSWPKNDSSWITG